MRRTKAKLDKQQRRLFGSTEQFFESEADADIHDPFKKCQFCYFMYIRAITYDEHLKCDHKKYGFKASTSST
jgi:hypothetical protein